MRNYFFEVWRRVCRAHNFVEYAVPTLQPTELFIEKSGPEIVSQLFNFTDKGGREVTLPPEATPYVAQMVGAKAASLKRPIRYFSIPQCFRYERPQKGRGREFYQLNADIFDEPGTTGEAEILALAIDIFKALGLGAKDFAVRLSDRTLWLEFLAALGFDEAKALEILPIVDKWEREEPSEILKKLEVLAGAQAAALQKAFGELMAVKSLEALEQFVREQKLAASEKLLARIEEWKALLRDLAALGYADFIQVDMGIVRGLAYYTGFVFELFERTGQGRAIAGGGRFNNLVKKLGGPDMAAVGIAMSDVAVMNVLSDRGLLPEYAATPAIYLAYTSEFTRAKALELLPQLRAKGCPVECPLKPLAFGKQLKAADKSGARKAIIIGDDELSRGVCKLKDLRSGAEEELPLATLPEKIDTLEAERI